MAEVPSATGKNHLESSLKTSAPLECGKCYGGRTAEKGTQDRNAWVGAAILNGIGREGLMEKRTIGRSEGGKGGIIQYLGEECLYNTNSQVQNASGAQQREY